MKRATSNGKQLVVLRPVDQNLAIELGRHATSTGRQEDLDAVLLAQPYSIVGYLGIDQQIYTAGGEDAGTVRPGDSIVTADHKYVLNLHMPS